MYKHHTQGVQAACATVPVLIFLMVPTRFLFVFALARCVAADVRLLSDANIEDTQALLTDWGLHKQFGREV